MGFADVPLMNLVVMVSALTRKQTGYIVGAATKNAGRTSSAQMEHAMLIAEGR